MADPHRPLYLDDPIPYGDEGLFRLATAGWTIILPRNGGFIARKRGGKGNRVKLVLSEVVIRRVRDSLGRAQGWRCAYCNHPVAHADQLADTPGTIELQIEHRVPISRGGTWKRFNILGSCKSCNTAKADLSENDFRALLERFPPEPSGRWRAQVKTAASKMKSVRDTAAKLTACG